MNSATPQSSPIDEINAALHEHNPFAQPPILVANHVWGKGFPDIESLNAHASGAVFRALEEVRADLYPRTSILITAQDGTGKTHIISRVRRYLQNQGSALFVYATKFDDLDRAKQGFQQILADSLSNIGRKGMTQWQELATTMANDAIKSANLQAHFLPFEHLVNKFENADEEQARKWINQLTKAFRRVKDVKDPDVVRAIFWTLRDDESSYASNWLGGKELAQYKANELSLPNQNRSFDAVLQILALISEYNELVICFDELDTHECNDAGLHKSQVVAGLVKELFENLRRGVILTVMMPGTWNERVKQLPPGVLSRVTACGEPYNLTYMDGDSVVELVTRFLKTFYEEKKLVPPHSLYPFDENQLKEVGREKLTVRRVLMWCKDNCKSDRLPPPETDLVELAFINELSDDISNRLDDNYFLADALFFGFQTLINQTIEQVTIKEVTVGVKLHGGKDPYLNFKIVGEENKRNICIGLAVLQYDGGGSLGAGLKRLLDEKNTFALTRGCLVRSKNKSISKYHQKRYVAPLIQEKGGELVDLKEKEIKTLVAIRSVYQKRESDYKVTEEEILKFISNKGEKYWLGSHNPLLREILSDPSHQLPDDIKDEPKSSVEKFSNSLDVAESEDLEELMVHA